MGIKNLFKKSSKLFDREGFYVILFICLCIVAVTAVYISKNNGSTARKNAQVQEKTQQQLQQPDTSEPKYVEEEPTNETPVMQQQDKNSVTSQKTTTTDKTTNSTNKKSEPSKSVTSSIALKLEMPVQGEIVKKFDKENLQFSNTMQQWETHEGIDIACDLGTEVKAADSGKVVDVLNDDTLIQGIKPGYGFKVIIDHGNGLRTVYCNLDPEVKVKKGDSVKKGQVIGVVGDTAVRESVAVEGSHLHFIVLKKSGKDYITVNPQDFLQ
ncbi:M23 family metallopeptidase [Caloramator sp. E03]|uniref:M23 family metallopeptidase n=1 Tax=Caloramator sp. E03 TaxID=2576307 RepID=UPI00143D9494|nr:M23 family metallopeptidase [Caloramator sp. E03]